MNKNIFSNLDISYLTDKLGIDLFTLARGTYDCLSLDGIVTEGINDRFLAGLLLENSISADFFNSKTNLRKFIAALPQRYRESIRDNFDLQTVKWDDSLYMFFEEHYGINKRFKPTRQPSKTVSETALFFDEPEFPFKNLKDYQSIIYHKVYDYIKSVNFARCILQMPTGSGKTRTAMEIVSEYLNEHSTSVIWLANTEELVDQAFESFREVWGIRRKKPLAAYNHMRYSGDIDYERQSFHLNTLQGLNSKNGKELIEKILSGNPGIGLVIVDEAHISIAPTYRNTIKHLLSNEGKLVGLTATPGRTINRFADGQIDDNRELSDFYLNKLFQIDTGDKPPIEFLRERGILSNAKFFSIEGSYIESCLSPEEKIKMNETKKIPAIILGRLSNNSRRNAIILDKLQKLLAANKKVLFFATSIDHSKVIASLINLLGYNAAHVDGETGASRAKVIQQFKDGDLRLLSNFGVLTTGFDDPKIDVVFMARPTNSVVLYSQIIGRGLRGPSIGGTEVCEVYTINDNIVDLPSNNQIYSYFDEYFINTNAI
jgi:DNA repair protein RadD